MAILLLDNKFTWTNIKRSFLTEQSFSRNFANVKHKLFYHKMSDIDEFMELAFIEARLALKKNEVPVGCVFIYRKEVLARGGNQVNATKNATRHAEFVCVDQVIDYCNKKQYDFYKIFQELTVVVTVEPCIMCLAALQDLKVKEIFYGCNNDRFGGKTVLDVSKAMDCAIPMHGGFRAAEALSLLKKFYEGENPSAPVPKRVRR